MIGDHNPHALTAWMSGRPNRPGPGIQADEFRRDLYRRISSAGVDRIADQVYKYLPQLLIVPIANNCGACEILFHRGLFLSHTIGDQLQAGINQLVQVGFGGFQLPPSRKLRNIYYELVEVVNSTLDQGDRLQTVFVDRVFAQHLNSQSDTAEWIFDFM